MNMKGVQTISAMLYFMLRLGVCAAGGEEGDACVEHRECSAGHYCTEGATNATPAASAAGCQVADPPNRHAVNIEERGEGL